MPQSDPTDFISGLAAPFVYNSGSNTPVRAPSWKLCSGLEVTKNVTTNTLQWGLNVGAISSSFNDELTATKAATIVTYTDQRSIFPNSRRLVDAYGTKVVYPASGQIGVNIDNKVIQTTAGFNIISSSFASDISNITNVLTQISGTLLTMSGTIATDIGNLTGSYDVLAFGDGSDGDVTVTSGIQLTRDMYYNNLTLSAGGSIKTKGYIIYVKNLLNLDYAETHSISNDANNGGNASGITPGIAGTNAPGIQVGPGQSGKQGSDYLTKNGTSPTTLQPSNGGTGGRSGRGGPSLTNSGGSEANGGIATNSNVIRRFANPLIKYNSIICGGSGGGGAPSGGDSVDSYATAGGGGGGGGGVIALYANKISITTSTGNVFYVNGGNGGHGASGGAVIGKNTGTGAGGGGGGGGFIYIYCNKIIGTPHASSAAANSTGGNGGNGGTPNGTGSGGSGGVGGAGGKIMFIVASKGKCVTETLGANPVDPGFASGIGGVGGYTYVKWVDLV